MRNFSDLNNSNLQTAKAQIIQRFADKSGLPKEVISPLYEQYNFACGGVSGLVIQKLDKLFESKIENDSDIMSRIKSIFTSSSQTPEQKIAGITATVDDIESDSVFITAVLFILGIISQSAITALNESLQEKSNDGPGLVNGTESEGVSDLLDIDTTFYDEYDTFTTENRVELANSLKELLAKNNKRFGYNYHLDNVYLSILEVIKNTSEELAAQNNVTQLSSIFHDELLKGLFLGNIQPMWRDVNYLKTVIPDLQTLVFDMMVFVTGYILENRRYAEYMNIDTFTQFRFCANNLYNALIQSKEKSRLLDCNCDTSAASLELSQQEEVTAEFNFYNVQIRPDYLGPCGLENMKSQTVIDAIYMINSCRSEFNLGVRPVIRQYVTKALNIIQVLDRIKFEARKINKYKS